MNNNLEFICWVISAVCCLVSISIPNFLLTILFFTLTTNFFILDFIKSNPYKYSIYQK